MTVEIFFAAVVPAVLGVVVIRVASLMAARRLRPNQLVGIRTSRTLRSDEAWYVTHVAAAPWVRAAGILFMVGSVVSVAIVGRDEPSLFAVALHQVALLLPVAALMVAVVVGLRALHHDRLRE